MYTQKKTVSSTITRSNHQSDVGCVCVCVYHYLILIRCMHGPRDKFFIKYIGTPIKYTSLCHILYERIKVYPKLIGEYYTEILNIPLRRTAKEYMDTLPEVHMASTLGLMLVSLSVILINIISHPLLSMAISSCNGPCKTPDDCTGKLTCINCKCNNDPDVGTHICGGGGGGGNC